MSSAAVVIMASEPGSGHQERLHPFFTAARTGQNGDSEPPKTNQPTTQPYQDGPSQHSEQNIPIDPMLAMDNNRGSYAANGHGPPSSMDGMVGTTAPGDMHGMEMLTALPYGSFSESMQPGLVFSQQDLAAYGMYPYQPAYHQQPDPYGTMQPGPAYTQVPQYNMPAASTAQPDHSWTAAAEVPAIGILHPANQFPAPASNAATAPAASEPPPAAVLNPVSIPAQISTPKPAPPPIPLEKNAFARLQAKKKPLDKAPAPALEDKMPTQLPEAKKKRGRPPKKQKLSMGENQAQVTGESTTVTVPDTSISGTSTPTAGHDGSIARIAAAGDLNAPNPLQIMMTKATNTGSPAPPATTQKRLEVKYHYGTPVEPGTAHISQTIAAILEGKHRVFPAAPPQPAPAQRIATPAPKKAHPLFAAVRSKQSSAKAQMSGGSASKASAGPGPYKLYTATPCSPKRMRTFQSSGSLRMPQFGTSNGILRVPGACPAAWPTCDNVHVRPADHPATFASAAEALPYRKRKGNAVYLREEDSLLSRKLKHLSISSVVENMRNANGEHFPPPPPELRLPKKHVESGKRLKSRILPQLRSDHPGLTALSESISTTLSAFDRYSNEAAMWTQKYAPSCALEVLQSGDEPLLLKNWLEALKVVAVDTGAGDSADTGKGGSKSKPKKKRRKNKMDGFIVSSDDDEDDGLVDESEDETLWTASGKYGRHKKTAVRSGNLLSKDGRAAARLNNVVVISGPHGSGKSASVYAVAKELGFEVFEISAGSRRTGKDVTDRIGNMTTNHLVQHKKKKAILKAPQNQDAPTSTESTSDLEDCDGDDDPDFPPTPEPVQSAKQQTMSSFFKPKVSAAAPSTGETKPPQQTAKAGDAALKSKPGEQKQSLILLEEADILYEEDKQFWTTVTGLIAQAKRPFVITCTDETLIPLRLLRLHAIFRFTTPPVDPAVDRLLLVAASEGHALKREAAKSLFEARDHDMRASLTDLQFWCQIAVGAKASRFDWFIPRQPQGIDRDDQGHTKRIVSENTYWPGMGWLNHDVTISQDGLQEEKEDAFVQQAWSDWQLDVGQWQDSLDLATWASELERPEPATREDRLKLLSSYSSFAETMSDADMVSHKVFATGNQIKLDATEPEHPPGGPDEYPIGRSLLDRTIAAHENDHLRLPMATSLRCLAKAALRADSTESSKQLDPVDAAKVMGAIHREHTDAQSIALVDRPAIARIDIAEAFDAIAVKDTGAYVAVSSLEPSVFDRNMLPIVVDVAPYVRSIISHDEHLKKRRQKLSTFLTEAASSSAGVSSDGEMSEGPLPASRRSLKRMRTTRTALSALEGGSRSITRNGSWFTADINPLLVMNTAGPGWDHAAAVEMAKLREAAAKADEAAALAASRAAAQAAAQAAMAPALVPAPAGMPPFHLSMAPFPVPVLAPAPYAGPILAPAPMPYALPPSSAAPVPYPPQGQAAPMPYPQHAQTVPAYGQEYGQPYGQVFLPVYDQNGVYQTSTQHDTQAQNPPVDSAQQLA